MSDRLRDAARTLLQEIRKEHPIEAGSPLAPLRDALAAEDSRLLDIEPAVVTAQEIRTTRLVAALGAFSKPGGHYVGCPGDKRGHCSESCRMAQLAVDPPARDLAKDTIGRLEAELAAAKREWRHMRHRLRDQKLIHHRRLDQIAAETGFQMRSPGRPKKPSAPAGNAGYPGA